jgi:tRNA (cmo5U34)-methyltransferase
VTVGALFDEAAGGYDGARRRLVPGLDALHEALLEGVPFGVEEEIRVLDLGAGTGLLSAAVAERFPRARITLVDLSVEMLRVARRRFAHLPDRFDFRVMDFARKGLPGGYDLIVSALAIHHLTDGDKRELFEKALGSLVAGGWFANMDQVLGETPEEEANYEEWWLRSAREAGATDEDLAAAFRRMRADKNATLKSQLRWLGEAGFVDVGRLYEDHRFAVYAGRKDTEMLDNGEESHG